MSNKALVIGATGTIGSAVVQKLSTHQWEVVTAARSDADEYVDLSDPGSIRTLFDRVGIVNAIVSCAGAARFVAIPDATDEDWTFSLSNKLMGQVNLVRFGRTHISDGGSITLTTGVLADHPLPGSSILTTVNAGLQGFVRSSPLELTDVRVNAVSPGWVSETLTAMGKDPAEGTPAAAVAELYLAATEHAGGGEILAVN
ncbi:MAG: short chain dehydrogenase [Micrococcales bacterium]|nr:short chain dehydrogenase [Micrococcales bacterium]